MIITPILIVHRYLGVVLGLLMTIWCLSGFVMMYQPFPETTPAERAAGLSRLTPAACCQALAPLDDDQDVTGAMIEMRDGKAVMRAGRRISPLRDGDDIAALDETGVRAVAESFARANAIAGPLRNAAPLAVDQWTTAIWQRETSIWKTAFADGAYVYVSADTGMVIQDASARERLLNWFGAVPHWLYPTMLRQNAPLWSQVVIWSAALGVFLTVTGLIVGVTKLRGRSGAWFPYRRPVWFLHHVFGIFVGLFVLTWTFSGLLTMQPWGLFETPSLVSRADVTGAARWADARALLARAAPIVAAEDVVQLRIGALFGKPYLVVRQRDGAESRIGDTETSAALTAAVHGAGAPFAGARLDLLSHEDSYYYGHHGDVKMPVYRLRLADADATHIYIDPHTGDVLKMVDATAMRYRWLESALHDFDFLKARPAWDIIVLILLAAVTAACATGAWLSLMRIGRDAKAAGALLLRIRAKSARR